MYKNNNKSEGKRRLCRAINELQSKVNENKKLFERNNSENFHNSEIFLRYFILYLRKDYENRIEKLRIFYKNKLNKLEFKRSNDQKYNKFSNTSYPVYNFSSTELDNKFLQLLSSFDGNTPISNKSFDKFKIYAEIDNLAQQVEEKNKEQNLSISKHEADTRKLQRAAFNFVDKAVLRTGPFLGHLGCLARALPLGGVFRGVYDFICEYYASLMIFRGRCSLRF